MFIIKAGTSPAKMANGDIIVDMGQVLRNLSGVEQDKEKKSLMQQILDPKEVDDSSRDTKKALQIARKIARGEPVTPQEKDFLMRVDPKLAQMAQLAKQQGDRVKHALESASSKEEQQTAIDHIEEVYYHTNDTRFIPLAATYLKDKAFLNEYID